MLIPLEFRLSRCQAYYIISREVQSVFRWIHVLWPQHDNAQYVNRTNYRSTSTARSVMDITRTQKGGGAAAMVNSTANGDVP